jgi:hypothetical protein
LKMRPQRLQTGTSSFSALGQDHDLYSQTEMVYKIGDSQQVQSLIVRVVSSGQKCCWLVMMGQVCRICSGIWSMSSHSQTSVGWSHKFPRVLVKSAVSCME